MFDLLQWAAEHVHDRALADLAEPEELQGSKHSGYKDAEAGSVPLRADRKIEYQCATGAKDSA